jgi:hypothetical protein
MHILFLTDNFPPEGNAPATRTYEHALEWVRSGHKVTVITGAPNFPEGKVYPGYKNAWYKKEYINGIEVRRVKTFITANQGFIKRTLDFMSFMVSSFVAGLFISRPDVVIGTSPQFFTVVSAWAISRVKKKPFVFELRDIWPASITAVGAMKKSIIIRWLERLELFLYRKASAIIAVTHAFRNELIERGVPGEKIYVVLNGANTNLLTPREMDSSLKKELGLEDKFVVGYIGTHGMAHALDKVLLAAEQLQHIEQLVFLFVGGGACLDVVRNMILNKQLKNVTVLGRQPKSEILRYWSLCNIALVPLKDHKLFTTVIPSKIFEAMAMGIPMVAPIPNGEAASIIEATATGVVVEPEKPEKLAKMIEKLFQNPSLLKAYKEKGPEAAKNYSRQAMAEKMLKILQKLA